jgi:beta-glucosidase
VKSASFPVGIALGATWDPALVREIGAALGEEAKSKGAHVLLGPTINIHRSVTNGRNFECFSEDPILTAELAVAYVEGLQAQGVAATPKHFAGNESEIQRTTINSEIDERSLREVYLLPFEAVVERAPPWAIMSSYNKLNGKSTITPGRCAQALTVSPSCSGVKANQKLRGVSRFELGEVARSPVVRSVLVTAIAL